MLAQATPGTATGGAAEFWVFVVVGAVALGAAIAMVLQRNAVHAALLLVVNFGALAVLYAVQEAQFLAVVQIIVYAGAIMVLFLFVIMLLGVARAEPPGESLRGQRGAALLLGGLLFVALSAAVAGPYLSSAAVCGAEVDPAAGGLPCRGLAAVNADGNVRAIGGPLFTRYVWPFEVMSALLVIAAIGAIVLGRRHEAPEELADRQAPPPAPPGVEGPPAETAPQAEPQPVEAGGGPGSGEAP